jgi:hypothetical protein
MLQLLSTLEFRKKRSRPVSDSASSTNTLGMSICRLALDFVTQRMRGRNPVQLRLGNPFRSAWRFHPNPGNCPPRLTL